ncbi:hypothetical protein H2200_011523 [Cladophialophora chaetospira]|uniref:Uncharacterized protein n=1 Tax=Cladophialophora chaetospira TaxID=386627 RepID=A0AA38WZG5_9EURO|nr:hypothetical protein H2200_011523 [Cladophialophora chaetospira]
MAAPEDWKLPLALTSERTITFKDMIYQRPYWVHFQRGDYFRHELSGRFIRLEYEADGWPLRVQGAVDQARRFVFVEAEAKSFGGNAQYLTFVDRKERTLNNNGWAEDLYEMEELFGYSNRANNDRNQQKVWKVWKLYRHDGDYRYTPRTDLETCRRSWWKEVKAQREQTSGFNLHQTPIQLQATSRQLPDTAGHLGSTNPSEIRRTTINEEPVRYNPTSQKPDFRQQFREATSQRSSLAFHRNIPHLSSRILKADVPPGKNTSYQQDGRQEWQQKPALIAPKFDRSTANVVYAQSARKQEVGVPGTQNKHAADQSPAYPPLGSLRSNVSRRRPLEKQTATMPPEMHSSHRTGHLTVKSTGPHQLRGSRPAPIEPAPMRNLRPVNDGILQDIERQFEKSLRLE